MKTIIFDETKWKLVPVEPTREMLMAALDVENASYDNHQQVLTEQWKDMLAVTPTPPATEQVLTGCNCRWLGAEQVEWCELHLAHKEAIHEWAERAKTAEAKLKQPATEQAAPSGEPDMRHPKIQAILGAKARLQCELALVENILDADDPDDCSGGLIEYWGNTHDRVQALRRAATPTPSATWQALSSRKPLTIQEQQQEWADYINRCDSYDPPDRRHAFLAGLTRGRRLAATPSATEQAVPLTNHQFNLICQAIDTADTITMDGDYMLDSDDCIKVVRVMQALFDITGNATP